MTANVEYLNIIENNKISTTPNPATNNLTINLQQLKNLQNTSLSIYNIQGQLLIQQAVEQPLTEIDISTFAKGMYIVKVNNNKETLQSKFVKD